MSSRKDRREVTDGYAGVCSQCWRESRTFNPFPSPSTSPHERATLSPTREHTVPTPRGRLHPREVQRVLLSLSFSSPSPSPLPFLFFLSSFSLSSRDGRRHRDVSGWNGLLLAIVSVFFPGKTRVLGDGWLRFFFFFFLFPSRFFERANGGERRTTFTFWIISVDLAL